MAILTEYQWSIRVNTDDVIILFDWNSSWRVYRCESVYGSEVNELGHDDVIDGKTREVEEPMSCMKNCCLGDVANVMTSSTIILNGFNRWLTSDVVNKMMSSIWMNTMTSLIHRHQQLAMVLVHENGCTASFYHDDVINVHRQWRHQYECTLRRHQY